MNNTELAARTAIADNVAATYHSLLDYKARVRFRHGRYKMNVKDEHTKHMQSQINQLLKTGDWPNVSQCLAWRRMQKK
jgi:predicted DNA-binding protein YlxM (UPF0122 family)